MNYEDLLSVQEGIEKLKSLQKELEELECMNLTKRSDINFDTTKIKGGRKSFVEWYAEEKERIENEVEFCKREIQKNRKKIDEYIEKAPYPESAIIRYRVINGMSWEEIGEQLAMDRRTASRKFQAFVNLPTMPR